MIRAVLDVNVLLSAIIAPLGYSHRLVSGWEVGQFTNVTAIGLVQKLTEKLVLPRIARKYNIYSEDRTWVYGLLSTQAELIAIPANEVHSVTLDKDPEDDYVLATARLGHAQYLVTGDKKLLELGEYAGVAIVTPKEFHAIIEKPSASN